MSDQKKIEDWLALYADQFVAQSLEEGEFTVKMYLEQVRAKDKTATYNRISGHLSRLIREGKITVRKIKLDGKRCNAYRPVKK